MSRLLIVEDEKHLADGLRFNLEAEGYQVDVAADGETALRLIKSDSEQYDAVVLDVMLPGKDGFEVVSELRQSGYFLPVLVLTARGRPEDVLLGFEAGADDYLPKPFDLAILLARLRGLLRRHTWGQRRGEAARERHESSITSTAPNEKLSREAGPRQEDVFIFNGKTIDFGRLELRAPGQTIRLTLMEAELLRYLIEHAGKVVSRKAILEEIWGLKEDTDTRAIDNFIVRLRKYIEEEPSKPRRLLTVRGVGYQFVDD